MEPEERDHILRNKESLVSFTACNPVLLSILEQQGHLSKADVQEISYAGTPLRQAYTLYDIIVSKRNSYYDLLSALKKSFQTGAVDILENLNRNTHQTTNEIRANKIPGVLTGNSDHFNRDLILGSAKCSIAKIVNDWESSQVAGTVLEEWSKLARELDLTGYQIKQIRKRVQQNPEEIFEAIIEMLEMWKQNSEHEVTVGMLIDTLENIKWNEFARKR